MIETVLCQGIEAAILAADTAKALELVQNHQSIFLDPIGGAFLHAQIAYCAIKNANREILQSLLKLPVLSDIQFFKYCGHTPLSLAIEEGREDLLPLLLAKTDKNFALHMAVKLKSSKTIQVLMKKCVFAERLLHFLGLR